MLNGSAALHDRTFDGSAKHPRIAYLAVPIKMASPRSTR